MPDLPEAWLISVALNLFRNARSTAARRHRLLSPARAARGHGDPPPGAEAQLEAVRTRQRVRAALDRLDERERSLLLLRAEGYSYRDMAGALGLHEASVGTLLARAKQTFRVTYGETVDAS
jgi:RNA polymerase sigma factor (sigma-70 family)